MKNIKSGAMHYLFKMWEKVSPHFCCFILLCKERKGRSINNPVEGTRNDQFSILKFFSNLNLNGFMSPKPNRIKGRIAPEITRWFGFYDFTFFILFIFYFPFSSGFRLCVSWGMFWEVKIESKEGCRGLLWRPEWIESVLKWKDDKLGKMYIYAFLNQRRNLQNKNLRNSSIIFFFFSLFLRSFFSSSKRICRFVSNSRNANAF